MPEERSRQDSSRDLLEELEDGWATTPSASKVVPSKAAAVEDERSSSPNVSDIDEGWLDQLFPEDEDEDEEEEESEPELPDERLDPVAFAAAKKAQAERMAARKDRKKQKLEAKRARQRAKAQAMRQKQKGKAKRKGPPPVTRRPEAKVKKSIPPKPTVSDEEREDAAADAAEELAEVIPSKPKKLAAPTKRAPNTMQSIKLLAIVLAVLIAVAAIVAVLAK